VQFPFSTEIARASPLFTDRLSLGGAQSVVKHSISSMVLAILIGILEMFLRDGKKLIT
jgi:hypothetical protein